MFDLIFIFQSYIVTSLDSHILDFAELKYVRANITTIRLMNPSSVEVTTAVHDWRLAEKRNNKFSEIYADRIKTETAFFYDAVRMFLTSFRELNAVREIPPPTYVRCFPTQNKWNQGMQIINYLNEVNMKMLNIYLSLLP